MTFYFIFISPLTLLIISASFYKDLAPLCSNLFIATSVTEIVQKRDPVNEKKNLFMLHRITDGVMAPFRERGKAGRDLGGHEISREWSSLPTMAARA